jgi:palmitoyltransferase
VLATLLGLVARASARSKDDFNVDPQHIVVLALAGLFTLFTATLLGTHIRLICDNLTTVEHLYDSDLRERERAGLSNALGIFQCR